MSIMPETKKCPTCKMKYSYNPDAGVGLFCPHCASMGMPPKSTLEEILRKNQKKKIK
ncbi:MAG: hypothetical protein J6L69_07890 [Lachnospiraceae bacterium]|nr:hypothetical protein [Lachnospiraceae bacterium]